MHLMLLPLSGKGFGSVRFQDHAWSVCCFTCYPCVFVGFHQHCRNMTEGEMTTLICSTNIFKVSKSWHFWMVLYTTISQWFSYSLQVTGANPSWLLNSLQVNLEKPVDLIRIDYGRKLKYPEGTHTDVGRTCKFRTGRHCFIFANHCSSVSPSIMVPTSFFLCLFKKTVQTIPFYYRG